MHPLPVAKNASGDVGVQAAEVDTVAAYVEVVRPHMPPVLIGPDGMDACALAGQLLPGAIALTMFGFECNLSRPEPIGDFSVLIQAATGRDQLATRMPAGIHTHPAWQRVHALLDVWRDPGSSIYSKIDNVWLEFDVSGTEHVPAPNIFHGYQQVSEHAGLPSDQRLEVSREVLTVVMGRALDPRVLARLRSCFELLPSGAQIAQVGAMIARDTDAVRLCVRFADPWQVGPFLESVGWDGEQDRLDDLLAELRGRISHLRLDLDVTASIGPKIGLECYLEANSTPQGQQWAPFLEFLTTKDIAIDAKCQALLSYPGHADERREGSRWPAVLRQVSRLLGDSAISVFVRRIHHVKLVLDRGQPIEAKAYLSVRHLWVTPETWT